MFRGRAEGVGRATPAEGEETLTNCPITARPDTLDQSGARPRDGQQSITVSHSAGQVTQIQDLIGRAHHLHQPIPVISVSHTGLITYHMLVREHTDEFYGLYRLL